MFGYLFLMIEAPSFVRCVQALTLFGTNILEMPIPRQAVLTKIQSRTLMSASPTLSLLKPQNVLWAGS
jgi:hypothetical protein